MRSTVAYLGLNGRVAQRSQKCAFKGKPPSAVNTVVSLYLFIYASPCFVAPALNTPPCLLLIQAVVDAAVIYTGGN